MEGGVTIYQQWQKYPNMMSWPALGGQGKSVNRHAKGSLGHLEMFVGFFAKPLSAVLVISLKFSGVWS